MKNRIIGFFIGLVLIPILMGVCIVLFFLTLFLPIICFMVPSCITWKNKPLFKL